MRLIYRMALRLSLALIPLIAIWAAVFYFTVADQINDEADDSLEDYSELIMIRVLGNRQLPPLNDGSNNSYSITPVSAEYANEHPDIEYYDAEVYIPEKRETEPARIMTTIFQDSEGRFYELKVSTPTFEKDDLQKAILSLIVALYLLLLPIIIGLTVGIYNQSLKPLYALLNWLDGYKPGKSHTPVPNDTDIKEFNKLNVAAQKAVERSEQFHERQKQFIGNASHELQTPLAVLGNRMEWMLNSMNLNEEQMGEIMKMKRTLSSIVRLNKTLLLLTKIENNQFPDSNRFDIVPMIEEQKELYDEIYAHKELDCRVTLPTKFEVTMNDSLASVLLDNLIKNAYIHTADKGSIAITLENGTLKVSNDGVAPLDGEHIFDRFYRNSGKEGSTGLGLALVKAVTECYSLDLKYEFKEKRHVFSVTLLENETKEN